MKSGEISEVRQGEMGSVRNRLGSDHSAEVFGGAGGAGLAEFVPRHVQTPRQTEALADDDRLRHLADFGGDFFNGSTSFYVFPTRGGWWKCLLLTSSRKKF